MESFVERIERIRKEIFFDRGIKNARLAKIEELINMGEIEMKTDSEYLEIVKCPNHVENLFLFRMRDGIWTAFSKENEYVKQFRGRALVLKDLEEGKRYELCDIVNSDLFLQEIRSVEEIKLYNTPFAQDHYQSSEVDMIECVVCRDNLVILRMLNMEEKAMRFRASEKYENALEVVIDPQCQDCDICFSMENGKRMIIQNALLARALKSEGNLEVLDDDRGTYYYKAIFVRKEPDDKILENGFVRLQMGNLHNDLYFLESEEQY